MRRMLMCGAAALICCGTARAQTGSTGQDQMAQLRREVIEAINRQRAAYAEDVKANRELWQKLVTEMQGYAQVLQQVRQQSADQQAGIAALTRENQRLRQELEKANARWQQELAQEQQARKQADRELTGAVAKEMSATVKRIGAAAAAQGQNTGGGRTYTVQKGDTLSAIAQAFGVNLNSLKAANKVRGDTIYVGQKLIIPER